MESKEARATWLRSGTRLSAPLSPGPWERKQTHDHRIGFERRVETAARIKKALREWTQASCRLTHVCEGALSVGRGRTQLAGSLRCLLRPHEVVSRNCTARDFCNPCKVSNGEPRTFLPAVHRHRINAQCCGEVLPVVVASMEVFCKRHAIDLPQW